MSYNFHIGQDVVALKDHSQGIFKKDDTFSIKGIILGNCMCNKILLDIGIKTNCNTRTCRICEFESEINNFIAFFDSKLFAPLDELTDISELQEVLEQPLFQVK